MEGEGRVVVKGGSVGERSSGNSGDGLLICLLSFLSFQDAKKDDAVRKAYKYLAALHEVREPWAWWAGSRGLAQVQALYSCCFQNCSQLIQTIEDTGTIMREIRDLEEQVRSGNGHGNGGRPTDSSLFYIESL